MAHRNDPLTLRPACIGADNVPERLNFVMLSMQLSYRPLGMRIGQMHLLLRAVSALHKYRLVRGLTT
jgi:hypothetical protein